MRIFLSIKFHADQGNRARVEAILAALEELGHSAICIVRDVEDWGRYSYSPDKLMRRTLVELDRCDLVLVDLAEKGVGIGIEAGYAAARAKPLIVMLPQGADLSVSLAGIARRVLRYQDDLADLGVVLQDLSAEI